ncbi:multiple epidermal growth factor-like domains protein 6 isoform X4 [Patella vulgata]|uniref:multiple epidermal growth factor-like domains protein 6 isoform X4 n=1 Tax=Patella vulgata TaxID=6465 RepID=UPI0021806457|nr:multiple epidermal growth factor-like domains protein 6 isoform X4 [Patella vulgata]
MSMCSAMMWKSIYLVAVSLTVVSCGTLYFKSQETIERALLNNQDDKKIAAKPVTIEDVVCPGGTSQCPDSTTCCMQASGQYGCCPLPSAVCCSDKVHCCPSGTTCDVSAGKCLKQDGSQVFMSKKIEAKPVAVKDVVCPGGTSQCPDSTTCCKLSSGQYGCCPLPSAVCCSDGVHCCPSGTTCDTAAGKCNKQDGSYVFMSKKITAKPVAVKDVVCPGGTSKCPDSTTCCMQASGQYGCCPLPSAVCCSDKVHCCPSGTTCDVSAGKCLKQDGSQVFMSKKIEAKPVAVKDVVCPGGTSQCPDSTTCCKLSSGQYGCCPLPSAVCCSDGVHCCPSGTTCDTAAGKCNKQDGSYVFMSKKIAAKPVAVKDVVCPGGTSQCPDSTTCCMQASGQYGCCPLPSAVCCSDQVHCCPSGTTCDVSAGKCLKQDGSQVFMSKKIAAKPVAVKDVVCPGGTSQCPDSTTCCKLSSGQYGCCPLPSAVCCSDGVHCCPSGTTCDTAAGKCNKQDGSYVFMSKKVAAKPVAVTDVVCPGGTSQCPDGTTCCMQASGQYGCCPLPSAVCCSDGVHCCPSGTTCDTAAGKCNKQDGSYIFMSKKIAAKPVAVKDVVCPGGTSQCPDSTTCCKLSSGQYGCCPLPSAVCCTDGVHCCPSDTTCDTSAGKCNKQDGSHVLMSEKIAAKSVSVADVVCPDGTLKCPVGTTCCKMTSGQYGCCAIPDAVCCSDGVHCCPSGTTCDTAAGKCNKQDGSYVFMSKKIAAKPVTVEDVVCPGGTSQCPDSTTCCKLSSGQYGCCPLPSAVCCSDGVHCCPSGTTCDTSAGKCNKQDGSHVLMSKKIAAKPVAVKDVVCPGGTSQCPDSTTCCKLSSGQYGCCPLPSAVCCSDGVHCCPSGTTCDTSAGKCNKQDGSQVFMSKKIAAKPVTVEDVVCPGGTSQCPDSTTCCKLSSGQYGCCPLPSAVCCSDGVHCCPSGTTCDTAAGKCNKQDGSQVFMSKKIAAKPVTVEDVVCPGGTSQCPDSTTCCKLSSGQYGCCPLPSAVCCSDGVHCCPSGTTCDTAAGKCNKQDGSQVFMSKKIAAKPVTVEDVVCPGGTSQCPDSTTCCKLSSGQYGCCPLPSAVCCSDGVHCCPSGTTCDTAAGKCNKQDGSYVFMSKKIAAKPVSVEKQSSSISVKDSFTDIDHLKGIYGVMCPDGHSQCPNDNTCCKLFSGDYGCCPLPDATCCSDEEHCCPRGMTCDTTKSQCDSNGIKVSIFKKSPAKLKISCCGSRCCPDGYLCSASGLCKKLTNTEWMKFKNGF